MSSTQIEVNVRPEVKRGAAWLDEVRPGWDKEIDLTKLELDSCADCVVGQLFGLTPRLRPARFYQENYGFDITDEVYGFDTNASYAKLTEEWRDLIASRR